MKFTTKVTDRGDREQRRFWTINPLQRGGITGTRQFSGFSKKSFDRVKQYAIVVSRGRRGSVPEWLMGADCKSADYVYVGSNPTRPIVHAFASCHRAILEKCPRSSVVERTLGKGEVTSSTLVGGPESYKFAKRFLIALEHVKTHQRIIS